MTSDTIVAISTALGEAAISIVRVSGPRALEVGGRVFGVDLGEWKVRTARLVHVRDENEAVVDHGVALVFRGPHSYTGEDVVEFQGHGGLLVTQRVLDAFLKAGARGAEPGEFTQRAFLNGKMDLTQAEAVMDLIHAQSTLALRAANEQLSGAIGREAVALKEELVPALAHIEAFIDFPDEDISPETGSALLARIDAVIGRAQRLIATADQGRILRHGARTVICGEPNVGKSSLLNLLLGFERAIVSPTAGTTRDTIEEIIQVKGIPLRLVDTAGLRDGSDEIERIGIERTNREIERADLILEVVDGSLPEATAKRVVLDDALSGRRVLILNKVDLGLHESWAAGSNGVALSCQSGVGGEELRQAIESVIFAAGPLSADHPVAINARHKSCFERVAERLLAARTSLASGAAPEFIALEVREALQALGEVIGQVDVEEILDALFSSFCIGK
ncbi:MAG: tRNA uridine-5-carboxymethylaminomethyl(34) synthesis GTPase MnmE [Verrucomicrobiaceae bacterium]|nr:tRNA uridine-5-carboxymethylaminomethyl(34) synthesis GTPase MnmE [Verrucomicrobiaceae bacterium]